MSTIPGTSMLLIYVILNVYSQNDLPRQPALLQALEKLKNLKNSLAQRKTWKALRKIRGFHESQ